MVHTKMSIDNISVVVTTAPRQDCTLERTLDSIERCGWTPTVFAEPDSTPTNRKTVTNPERKGLYRNWIQAASWAVNQNKEYVLTMQDDCELHPGTKELIQQIQPLDRMGFLSLYTPSHYQIDSHGEPIKGIYIVSHGSTWGAVALLFETAVLKQLLTEERIRNWIGIRPKTDSSNWKTLHKKEPWRIKNSDYIIGSTLTHNLQRYLYYLSPSPGTHIAEFSTVGHSKNTGKRNAQYITDHSQPLTPQIFDELSSSRIGHLQISQSSSRYSLPNYNPDMRRLPVLKQTETIEPNQCETNIQEQP